MHKTKAYFFISAAIVTLPPPPLLHLHCRRCRPPPPSTMPRPTHHISIPIDRQKSHDTTVPPSPPDGPPPDPPPCHSSHRPRLRLPHLQRLRPEIGHRLQILRVLPVGRGGERDGLSGGTAFQRRSGEGGSARGPRVWHVPSTRGASRRRRRQLLRPWRPQRPIEATARVAPAISTAAPLAKMPPLDASRVPPDR
jgi:hypothetical protein